MNAAELTVTLAPDPGAVPVQARRLTAEAAALWQKFPPRLLAASWPATEHGRAMVVSQAMTRPYAAEENDQSRYFRRLGVIRMLDWLEAQPGSTWQDRWRAGCQATANLDWRDTAERWLKDTGRIAAGNRTVWRSLGGALGLLIGCDVIRPDLGWLLASATPAHLAADMARVRDPDGFAALQKVAGPASVSVTSTRRAMLQIAVMMSVKGGPVSDITVGDCLELLEARARRRGEGDNGGTYFYQLLHAAGFFPAGAPLRVGMLDPRVHGQQTAGQLIDRYDLACRPVRDLLVDYLNERRPGIDYVTMSDLAAPPVSGRSPDQGAELLPRHRRMGHHRPVPVGAVGGPLPGPAQRAHSPASTQAPQITHRPADPRTPARPAPPGRRSGEGTRRHGRAPGRRNGHRAR